MKQKINLYLLYATVSTLIYGLIAYFIKSGGNADNAGFWVVFGVGIAVYAYVFMALSLVQEKAPEKRSELTGRYAAHLLMFELGIQLIGGLVFHVVSDLVDHVSMFLTVLICLILNVPIILLTWLPEERRIVTVIEENEVLDQNYFSNSILYLDHVSENAGYDALTSATDRLKKLLSRIDVPMSDPASAEAISLDVSNKCIALETAINQKDASKILIISRQLLSLCDKIEREAEIAVICYKDPDFFHTDNEIAEAQMDLILDQYGIEEEEDVVHSKIDLANDLRFKKALRFADASYREILNGYVVEMNGKSRKKEIEINEKQFAGDKISSLISSVILPVVFVLSLGIFLLWVFAVHPAGFSYDMLDDGTVIITGYNPLCGNDVEIPAEIKGKDVTVIGERAFRNCRKIVSVKVPENVTTVKFDCFNGCSSLNAVYLPSSLEEVQMYAFKGCSSLGHIYYAGSEEDFEGEVDEYGNRISGVKFSSNGFMSTDSSSDSKAFEHFKKDGKIIYNANY